MKLRQGTFSFLPDLTDAEIHTQVQYCIDNGWAVSVEYTDDYIRVIAFDSSHGWESIKLSFIVNRPKDEPGFHVSREEVKGRSMRYSIKSYATENPEGRRY